MDHSRRNFLKTTGCLTIGFCLGGTALEAFTAPGAAAGPLPASLAAGPLPGPLPPGPGEYDTIDAWLEVLADGRIRILTGKLELGQGIATAVAQVAAEELEMEMARVEVTMAETGRTPDEGYTAGSNSIATSAMAIRRAAASAREQLLELAAQKMNMPVADLTMAQGKISTKTGTQSSTFAEILDGRQLTGKIRPQVRLKAKDSYRLVGKPIPREDTGRVVSGQPVFVHDLHFPGMVHARVVRPPAYDAQLLQLDEPKIKDKIPGLLKIVVNGSFLGVITTGEYQSIQAQRLLRENSTWSPGSPLPNVSGRQLPDYLLSLPVKTEQVSEKGNMTPPAENATVTVKARYSKPYIMHGATGPSCAIALYDAGMLHIWTHSQGVYPLRESMAKMLQLPVDKIHIKGVPGSGCYGHNGADDAAADAALLALAYPGKHVRVQWMREDDHGGGGPPRQRRKDQPLEIWPMVGYPWRPPRRQCQQPAAGPLSSAAIHGPARRLQRRSLPQCNALLFHT